MRKPYLINYMEETTFINSTYRYYDNVSQLSYTDSSKERKLVDRNKFGRTKETRTVENSDSDQLLIYGGTKETFTKEDSDHDEIFYSSRTRITETIEDSDKDELLQLGITRSTNVIEDSDPDEFMFF